ncbi:hypothetical protein EX30DRAFT_348221 [Ascodesmis nigricans]|uniref:EXPERA domain-containing protein n=1 Tax=Ascodesmis nigricans TaxID=341454 RepID=A0A4S2MYK0_9PEZI|nr:hypothetical protein EX30DRAFT_348221 [Ascodesmis nigricans]
MADPTTTIHPHPYYPTTLSLPTYAPIPYPPIVLMSFVAIPSLLAASIGYYVISALNPSSTRAQRVTTLWFLFSGLIHTNFEGYWLRHHEALVGSSDVRAVMWREYAKSDSRYLTSDGFILGVEKLTVYGIGPLCLAVYIASCFNFSWNHPLRIFVSGMHVFSVSLYLVTAGFEHTRPEPQYFWGYFVAMNVFWLIVPAVLAWQSSAKLMKAEEAAGERKRQ